ncbi:hypothetical protein QR721_03785 [Aciduricibacillus chroicocephali]|uniref:Uncharacterized protein n=1 Tax=Aciduricibacillus chroicocephali TaxID=3054939 RepID=A0ABY9KWX3_9BACI|nr:hypothetical protein QR721_03785 [Bacillaceae bacterium 44XB]
MPGSRTYGWGVNSVENLTVAESRERDADIAKEMMTFTGSPSDDCAIESVAARCVTVVKGRFVMARCKGGMRSI